jgi:hypothetical protein
LSRSRKKKKHTSSASSRPTEIARPKGSRRWVVPAMVTFLVVGLAWIVVFYLTQGEIPVMSALGNWNLVIGMGLILLGLLTAMLWE